MRRTPRGDGAAAVRPARGGFRPGPPLRIVCPRCRYRIYDYPRLCVGFAVVRAGSLLVLTRAHEPRRGWRDLPGGFLEAGEDFESAARRELWEETGLRVGRAERLGTYWDTYFLRGFGRFPTLSFYYVARWRAGAPRAADDARAAEWVPFPRLTRRLPVAWPHMRDVFRDVKRWSRGTGRE